MADLELERERDNWDRGRPAGCFILILSSALSIYLLLHLYWYLTR